MNVQQSPTDPICVICGEPKSQHTKKPSEWRDVPGCTGHYLTQDEPGDAA